MLLPHRLIGVLLVALMALGLVAVIVRVEGEVESGPYEDITDLLQSAAASAEGLAALDRPGAPRVVDLHHTHSHSIPHAMPQHVAEQLVAQNTPVQKVKIVEIPNQERSARHAAEDALHNSIISQPSVTTVNVKHTVSIPAGAVLLPSKPSSPLEYTIKGPRADPEDDKYHFPLVDRGLQRPRYSVIAELTGVSKADKSIKNASAKQLKAQAKKLLKKAKRLEKRASQSADQREQLGVFDQNDANYEDELTRLKRVAARMNRLLEQIQTPHNGDSFEGSIARKRYFLKIYKQLKRDATNIIEAYALRTGNSIFAMFGDGKIDPSIAAFLPPNSVAAILAQYANPTTGRDDETPRDLLSGKDAKRIQYSIDYYKAKKAAKPLPPPPVYAPSDEELERQRRDKDPRFNKVVARQKGAFGQDRPAITAGQQAIGRSSLHISTVNPTSTQDVRGLPFQVNLKRKRPSSK